MWFATACGRSSGDAAKNLNNSGQHSPAPASADGTADGDQAPTSSNNSASNVSTTARKESAVLVPAGTPITVRLQQSLSSRSSVTGERFEAVIDEPVQVNSHTILPLGAAVTGHVMSVRRSGRLRHPGEIALTLDSVNLNGHDYSLRTSAVVAHGGSHKKRNVAWIGGGTAGGALIGALAGGGKGALLGSGVGAAAGTTTAFITGKKDVGFAAERLLRFRLSKDLSVAS
jgi:hypothetical protein